jgi:hypothetical protein
VADTRKNGRTTPKGTNPNSSPRPTTLDRLQSKKGIVRRIPVYVDTEVHEEYEAAQAALLRLDTRAVRDALTDEAVQRIQDRYDKAKVAEDENVAMLVLQRPEVTDEDGHQLRGRAAYEHLLSQFAPNEEEIAEYRAQHEADDPDGVPAYSADIAPHLISACLLEPKMTPEQVEEELSEWTLSEYMAVFGAAMECSTGTQIGSLGKGSGVTSAFTRN